MPVDRDDAVKLRAAVAAAYGPPPAAPQDELDQTMRRIRRGAEVGGRERRRALVFAVAAAAAAVAAVLWTPRGTAGGPGASPGQVTGASALYAPYGDEAGSGGGLALLGRVAGGG